MQPLPLNDRLDRIAQHIVRARLFLDLWFYFEGVDTRPRIIDTMRAYNEFFRFTPHAYLATYVIYIAGVFEKRKDSISLDRLLREVKATGRLKAGDAAAAEQLLTQAQLIAGKVTILRHNAFAHRSAHITYNDVFESADVTPNQLCDLTDMALRIANQLRTACALSEQHFSERPREAAEASMGALAKGRIAHEEK
jgi:hypothetical protein